MADLVDRKPTVGLTTEDMMRGMVVLLAADRDDRAEARTPARSDYVLADAGFDARQIANLTGRNYESVRSTLRRRSKTDG